MHFSANDVYNSFIKEKEQPGFDLAVSETNYRFNPENSGPIRLSNENEPRVDLISLQDGSWFTLEHNESFKLVSADTFVLPARFRPRVSTYEKAMRYGLSVTASEPPVQDSEGHIVVTVQNITRSTIIIAVNDPIARISFDS